MKRATYEEQPVVKFQYQTLVVVATSVRGDFVAWSTFPHLNNMLASNLRIPAVSVRNNTSATERRKASLRNYPRNAYVLNNFLHLCG